MPQVRAINSAATGTIAGSVTSDYTGATRPIANANVTLCGGAACEPPNAYIVATSRSDSAGRYAVAFVRAGSYTVRVEQPDYPFLNPVILANVTVSAGDTTRLAASLPKRDRAAARTCVSLDPRRSASAARSASRLPWAMRAATRS